MPFPDITIPPETNHNNLLNTLQRFFVAAMPFWKSLSRSELPYYAQDGEPTLSSNSVALWKDTNGGPAYYLVANFSGTQKKVALT